MGKYKFRGLSISTGKWVYGDLITYPDGETWINVTTPREDSYVLECTEVHPETVGQWTGLKLFSEEVYEGDIIGNGRKDENAIVEWSAKTYRWVAKCDHDEFDLHEGDPMDRRIGTIHDEVVTK
jgi:hypothetical protein